MLRRHDEWFDGGADAGGRDVSEPISGRAERRTPSKMLEKVRTFVRLGIGLKGALRVRIGKVGWLEVEGREGAKVDATQNRWRFVERRGCANNYKTPSSAAKTRSETLQS